jgi:hypothetical protein
MRRARIACAVLAVGLLAAGCGSSGREISDRYGECTFRPRAVCPNQDLSSIAASNSNLNGADLSGTNLTGADLRDVSFRGANLAKAVLNGADLTGADLRNANLSGAALVGTTLDQADLSDTNQTGVTFCNTVMPDGTVTDCKLVTSAERPTKADPPPRVLTARARRPVRCIVDGIGDGLEIDYSVKYAQSVLFSVDGVRASVSNGQIGIQRIPFPCDGHPHRVQVQAFGRTPPVASRSFTVSVEEGTPAPFPN